MELNSAREARSLAKDFQVLAISHLPKTLAMKGEDQRALAQWMRSEISLGKNLTSSVSVPSYWTSFLVS